MTEKKGYTIHIIGGGIGGVGKSTTGKLLAEYYLEIKKEHWLVDCDELLPDVGLAYQKDLYQSFRGEKTLTLSDKEKKFDRQIIFSGNFEKVYLLERVWELAEERDVLLILPSQVEQYVDTWLEENDFVAFASSSKPNPIYLKYWFVCNGTEPSVKMFSQHLNKHPQLVHVFVENRGRSGGVDWDFFDRSGEIKKLREEKKCHRFKIDRLTLSPETWELINKEHLTFKDASIKKDSSIDKAEQNRINKWLEDCKQEVEKAMGDFPVPAKV
jgi:hypothetical protein